MRNAHIGRAVVALSVDATLTPETGVPETPDTGPIDGE